MNANSATKPRMMPIKNLAKNGPVGVLKRCCTTRRRNAHGITEYELLYPWHPWAGCLVHIHEVVEKAGREVFVAASLVGHPGDGWRFRPGCSIGRPARPGVLAPLPMLTLRCSPPWQCYCRM